MNPKKTRYATASQNIVMTKQTEDTAKGLSLMGVRLTELIRERG